MDRVVKSVFLESKRLCELGHRNWFTKVWELAQSYNLNIDSLDDSNDTKHLIKSTVTAKYVSDLHAKLQDINNNPILRTYKLFKKELKWECYLNGVKNPKYSKVSNQFPHLGNRTRPAHWSYYPARATAMSYMPLIRRRDSLYVAACSRTSATTFLIKSKISIHISAITAT